MQRIIPHDIARPPVAGSSENGGFYFLVAGILFFLLVVGAGGALFALSRSQKSVQEDLRARIAQKTNELNDSDIAREATDLEGRLNQMRGILDRHVLSTNTIRFLESIVHPAVRFSGFSFSADKRSLATAGVGKGYSVVTQQIDFIRRDQYVEKVEFGGLSMDTQGNVPFSVTITFKPAFLTMLMDPDFGLPLGE